MLDLLLNVFLTIIGLSGGMVITIFIKSHLTVLYNTVRVKKFKMKHKGVGGLIPAFYVQGIPVYVNTMVVRTNALNGSPWKSRMMYYSDSRIDNGYARITNTGEGQYIVLPECFYNWSSEKQLAMLGHELGHIMLKHGLYRSVYFYPDLNAHGRSTTMEIEADMYAAEFAGTDAVLNSLKTLPSSVEVNKRIVVIQNTCFSGR